MKKEVKMSGFKQITVSALSTAVLAIAEKTTSTACLLFYYQPKTPQNIKTRLAKARMK